MPSANTVRKQIENLLVDRIPSALTPVLRPTLPLADTGIRDVDQLLNGGFPIGAITELVGPEGSGRTSLAFSFLAQRTQDNMSCAWVDISGSFDPESAAANGIDLKRLLWVCCGTLPIDPATLNRAQKSVDLAQYNIPPATIKALHGGGHGPHPQTEIKGLSKALNGFLQPSVNSPQIPADKFPQDVPNSAANLPLRNMPIASQTEISRSSYRYEPNKLDNSPWARLDQALRVTDLLLQGGGFASIVLDAGSLTPEQISRVPLSTWFRYRSVADKTQTCLLLLTQYSCSKSSAALVLNLLPGKELLHEPTVFAGIRFHASLTRGHNPTSHKNVIQLKSSPHSERFAEWNSFSSWEYRQ
jgi:recombination protein RecA